MSNILAQECLSTSDRTFLIKLEENQALNVTTTKPEKSKPFRMVSLPHSVKSIDPITNRRVYMREGINFIQELCTMSRPEQRVISMIEQRVKWDTKLGGYNYEASITQYDFDDQSQYKAFSKGYKLLFDKDIVRRISKGKYMINPQILLPAGSLTEYFMSKWESAKATTNLITTNQFDGTTISTPTN